MNPIKKAFYERLAQAQMDRTKDAPKRPRSLLKATVLVSIAGLAIAPLCYHHAPSLSGTHQNRQMTADPVQGSHLPATVFHVTGHYPPPPVTKDTDRVDPSLFGGTPDNTAQKQHPQKKLPAHYTFGHMWEATQDNQ